MTDAATPPTTPFVHVAAIWESQEQLVDLTTRFLREGIDAGDALALRATADVSARVRSRLPDDVTLTLLPSGAAVTPARSISDQLETVRASTAHCDSGRARIAGQVPTSRDTQHWEPWARYEAALNDIFAEVPFTGLCLFDGRRMSDGGRDDVLRTHPLLVTDDGVVPSERYAGSAAFLSGRPVPSADLLQSLPPATELSNPTPREARHTVAGLAARAGLPAGKVDSIVLAVSEVVTNADLHGSPPVTVSAWAGPGRVVVSVHDLGTGPDDIEAGLVPKKESWAGLGFGLWIAHLMCDEVVQHADDSGFTVRLTAQVA